MNQWIQMRAIRDEDKMDFIDPAEGNSHITAGSEIDIKAKKDAYIYVKTKITNCGMWLHQNDHSCHWKFLVVHARDRVSLKSLPSNGKPVVPVFRQVCHFQTGPKPTGTSFRNVMPSSGQKGPAGKIKPSVHQSFAPPFFLFPHVHLPCLAFSLPVHRKAPRRHRRRQTQVSMTWPFLLEAFCATFYAAVTSVLQDDGMETV